MRLLADDNSPLPAIEALRHEVTMSPEARTDHPGTKDAALLELAESDRRVPGDAQHGLLARSRSQRRQFLEQSAAA
jgi:hypothetical protein